MNTPNLDLEKLRPDGSHYAVVSLSMPNRLWIPDDNYVTEVEWDSHKLVVQVILEEQNSVAKIYIPVRGKDWETHKSFETILSNIFRDHKVYRSIAVIALNKVINLYRFLTGEYQVKPITTQNDFDLFLLFNELSPEAHQSKFTAHHRPYKTTDSLFQSHVEIPSEVIATLKKDISLGSKMQFVDELLLNAYDYLAQGNPRIAIIEAETGFESAILQYIQKSYYSQPDKLQKLDHINSFKAKIDHRFSVALLSTPYIHFVKGEILYDDWVKQIWKVRGNLVHGREENVHPNVAKLAIDCIENALEHIIGRKKTKLRKYARYSL